MTTEPSGAPSYILAAGRGRGQAADSASTMAAGEHFMKMKGAEIVSKMAVRTLGSTALASLAKAGIGSTRSI